MRTIIRARGDEAQIRLLLGAQTLFSIGFYAVVPFLAIVLSRDFGLAGAAVGLVLGVRTFCQQGMFLIGGTLSDRFGPKAIMLVGIATRSIGFALLAAALASDAPNLGLFVCGTVLTGFGGAMFSPGLNVLVAAAEHRRARGRVTLFAWLSVTGEIGAVLGPLVGSALLGLGFNAVSAAGAVYFALIGVLLQFALPRDRPRNQPQARGAVRSGARDDNRADDDAIDDAGPIPRETAAARPAAAHALRDRGFLVFAALHSVDLLAYNQLYLAVPLVLVHHPAPARAVAIVFAWISLLTLAAQLPIARWSARLGPRASLCAAYLLSAGGFALIAAAAALPGDERFGVTLAAATCFGLGHLTAGPTALHLVPGLAPAGRSGSYLGLLATMGGIAVLLGNGLAGAIADSAPERLAWMPWLLLGLAPLVSAVVVPRALGAHPRFAG